MPISAAYDRIHILGASGSGTTTFGRAIAARFGHTHLDVDDFFWEKTDPPFTRQREVEARRAMLGAALEAHPRWVLTGSLVGWGDVFIPRFQLVIFTFIPHELRMERLIAREIERYGARRIGPGGDLYQHHLEFIQWARAYDSAGAEQRSLFVHEQWLKTIACPVLRLEGAMSTDDHLARLYRYLK